MKMTIKTGYKATDKNIQCRGFQFVPGQWHEIGNNDPLELCENGFHYCEQPSGVWAYYTEPDTRVWKVETEDCIVDNDPGADAKSVCRRIRLVEEVQITGDRNTGDRNTGDRNTGDRNTGNWNTGDRNTGNWNTGYGNTGNWNTGYGNTGNWNTGYGNTGYGNTGDRNTGYGNTGYGNATNYSSGFFCSQETTVTCFDVDSGLLRDEFTREYPEYYDLSVALLGETEIDYSKYFRLPGITPEKLKTLHTKHIEARKKQ